MMQYVIAMCYVLLWLALAALAALVLPIWALPGRARPVGGCVCDAARVVGRRRRR
jgi:hypothetical protein